MRRKCDTDQLRSLSVEAAAKQSAGVVHLGCDLEQWLPSGTATWLLLPWAAM